MGSVVVSVDAELGWGFHDVEAPPTSRIEAGRSGWRTLLGLLDAHDVPATWAVVGHLFEERCDGVHADHPSLAGWFARERGAWNGRSDLRFGPGLIADVLDSPVDHEIACHSYSHAPFGDPRLTTEIARAEVARAIEAARSFGVEYDSFVFPRNAVGHREVLAEFGFTCYRGAGTVPLDGIRRTVRKVARTVDPDRVDLVEPVVDEHGLVDVPPSLYLFGFEGRCRRVAEWLWTDPVLRQARRGIDRAAREDGVFHLWLHPNNLQTERDVRRVRAVVEYAAARRDRTPLTVETMASVAERVSPSSGGSGRRSRRRARTAGGRRS